MTLKVLLLISLLCLACGTNEEEVTSETPGSNWVNEELVDTMLTANDTLPAGQPPPLPGGDSE